MDRDPFIGRGLTGRETRAQFCLSAGFPEALIPLKTTGLGPWKKLLIEVVGTSS